MNYLSAPWGPAPVRMRPPRPPTWPRSSEIAELSAMDYGALPPEINSGRMYAGPGAGSMLAAAGAWDGLSADLHATAAAAGSVVSGLTGGSWRGAASTSMAAAAAPFLTWMSATAAQSE